MLQNVTAKELSGRNTDVCVATVIPVSAIHGTGVLRQANTLKELTLPWLTEHHSMTAFRLPDIYDVTEFEPILDLLPTSGYLVKLWCMWSLLDLEQSDIIAISEVIESAEDASEFMAEGYIFIQDIADKDALHKAAAEWADIQSTKHITLSEQVSTLSEEEFFTESEKDGFVGRLRSLATPHS